MGVGMCSNKKRNGGGSVVVWFVVLGLALLVDTATAKRKQGGAAVHLPGWYCQESCRGKQEYLYCLRRCMASPSSGAALRLACHRGTGEEGTRGGGGVGLQAEGAGQEERKKKQEEGAGREEEERKQGNMVVHPPWSCELECEDIADPDFDPDSYMACVRDCYKGFGNAVRRRGADGGEEARGGGGAGLLEMLAERARWEEGKRKQEDATVHLSYSREDYCYDLCIRKKGPKFPKMHEVMRG